MFGSVERAEREEGGVTSDVEKTRHESNREREKEERMREKQENCRFISGGLFNSLNSPLICYTLSHHPFSLPPILILHDRSSYR